MKIGILTDHIDSNHPSYTVYITNLLENLEKIDGSHEYYLVHHTRLDLNIYSANKEVIIPLPPLKQIRGPIWRYVVLPRELRRLKFDLVHDPTGSGIMAMDFPGKKVITINDLTSLLFPRNNLTGMISHKLFDRKTVKNSDKIIAISESTKNDIIRYWKAPEEKVRVVYDGIDEQFRPAADKETGRVRERYGLHFPFILFVGVLQPRKNVPNLIRAYYLLHKTGAPHRLVIAGGKGWQYDEIFKTVRQLKLEKDVIFTGKVPGPDLPGLYSAADLFAFPSMYEGFGLPPLEAMACGTPVITSNTSSLPEVVGDAGIMADPRDIDRWAQLMHDVLGNSALRQEMTVKGLERAKRFSWEACARQTLEVYKEAAGQP